MNLLDAITRAISYPQSLVTGLAAYSPTGLPGVHDGEQDILMEGLKGNLRPSRIMEDNAQGDGLGKWGNASVGTTADVLLDPTLLLGGALKTATAGTKLEGVAQGASAFGKLEDASKAQKAGQFGRRYYQGLMATGDPLAAIGAGTLIGTGERAVQKISPAITRALARSTPDAVEATAEAILKGPAELPTGPKTLALGPGKPRGPITTNATFGSSPIPTGAIKPDEILQLNKANVAGELPVGARPWGAPEGAVPLDEALQQLLGRRQGDLFGSGERPDTILRALLENRRSGKGKFLTADQQKVLQTFIDNPDAIGTVMRKFYGSTS